MRIPFNHIDVEPGSLSCTIDETVSILKHKQRSVMYRGDYIEYNDETKKYDIYIDVSRHGSPSYEKAAELSEEESRFLRACESFFDIYNEL